MINYEILPEHILLVNIKGEINAGSMLDFNQSFDKLFDKLENYKKVILDFEECIFISSIGLAVILKILKLHHLTVKLTKLNKNIKKTFYIVKFDKLFEIYDTVEEAENSFN